MISESLVTSFQRCSLRAEFSILSEGCPFDQGNPSICPFHEIRERSQEERMAWFDELSDEAILTIYTYCIHNYCLLGLEVKRKVRRMLNAIGYTYLGGFVCIASRTA